MLYDRSQPRSEAAAREMARLMGGARTAPMGRGPIAYLANGAMLAVVVGKSFGGTIAPPRTETKPKRQPPYVRKDRSATLPFVRWAQKRVPFRLAVPTVLERSSYPYSGREQDKPVRVYEVEGHKAVRLTFYTGSPGEFWGIQETDWQDAPALSENSSSYRIGGRTYDFHYSGSHLHMVVRHEGDTTYWVINTLLDKLSNETMIAIAKGLRPLKTK